MKKIFNASLFIGSFLLLALGCAHSASAATFDATLNVRNAGAADQTDATSTSQANIAQVKASTTLSVSSLAASSTTFTIGSCVVTFTTVASSTVDETNCNDNAASIDRTLSTGDTLRTTAQVAAVIQSLTNVSSTLHSGLSIIGTTTLDTTFRTTGSEISSSNIEFSSTTGGAVTATHTTGAVATAQITTITIGGAVETGDVYSIILPTGTITYTVLVGDSTASDIAEGVQDALNASSTLLFTALASTNTVVLTAKNAGTGFTLIPVTTNASAVAQVVVFTPVLDSSANEFVITINGTDYTYTAAATSIVDDIVSGLKTLLDANADITCTEDNTAITCTAVSAGTAFTYDTSVNVISSGNSNNNRSSGSHRRSSSATKAKSNPVATVASAGVPGINGTAGKFQFTVLLQVGSMGADVTALQQRLTVEGVYTGPITGYFGPLTMAGVKAYQAAHGIDQLGIVGPMTRASLNK